AVDPGCARARPARPVVEPPAPDPVVIRRPFPFDGGPAPDRRDAAADPTRSTAEAYAAHGAHRTVHAARLSRDHVGADQRRFPARAAAAGGGAAGDQRARLLGPLLGQRARPRP